MDAITLRVFAVSGFSGTGKTSLIEDLIKELKSRGYSVSVVKSSREDIEPPKGTDTYRHLTASASPVVLLGPNTTTIRYQHRLNSGAIFSQVDADIVLLEGFKSALIPRVFCVGKRGLNEDTIPEQTHAIVTWNRTDMKKHSEIPILYTRETDRIADLILQNAVQPNQVDF
ncbi:molybdopterin-guanine dinucleotide biosynthesis protein B [Candidatus Thorarchaeota archaeon]|nr:MAG: molybdopterin-guanine dinucleotide biosynthesis protein B [Candidatus Thorarchaeota archaeon]